MKILERFKSETIFEGSYDCFSLNDETIERNKNVARIMRNSMGFDLLSSYHSVSIEEI